MTQQVLFKNPELYMETVDDWKKKINTINLKLYTLTLKNNHRISVEYKRNTPNDEWNVKMVEWVPIWIDQKEDVRKGRECYPETDAAFWDFIADILLTDKRNEYHAHIFRGDAGMNTSEIYKRMHRKRYNGWKSDPNKVYR